MVFHIFCGRIFSDSQMNVTQVNMDIGNYHFYRLTLPLGVWQARDKNYSQYSHILPGVFYWRPSILWTSVNFTSVWCILCISGPAPVEQERDEEEAENQWQLITSENQCDNWDGPGRTSDIWEESVTIEKSRWEPESKLRKRFDSDFPQLNPTICIGSPSFLSINIENWFVFFLKTCKE